MRKREMRAYMPAVILLLGCALVYHGTRDQVAVPLGGSLSTVLDSVPGYRIQEQRVSDEERRVAGMTDYVARVYWSSDSTVAFTTYVGYYDKQAQGKSMHSPKNCLPGAGWEVLRDSTATVMAADGPHVVNRYLLKNGAQQAVVYYWYQGRGRVVASEYLVKWDLLRDAALEGHTEEALVRLIVFVDRSEGGEARAERLAQEIAPKLLDDVKAVLPVDAETSVNRQVASKD